jgi:monofunctional biosynthetic peptidoglycan transglycosylase
MARIRAGKRGWFGRLVQWTVVAIFLFVLLSVLWVLLYRAVNPPITLTMLGDRIGGRNLSREWMSLERVDRDMVRAVVAAEDSKFCAHSGFDQDAIAAAMRRNARGGAVIRGGSTISQQTAKNAFLWQGGGYFRKGLEAWFTLLIENMWGKRRIMEVYLNIAETGIGTYGVNAGAMRYFNHDAAVLSRTEAARIAAVLPLPKQRGASAPVGFTRRYGNAIAARIGVVAREGLDGCVYAGGPSPADEPAERPSPKAQPRPAVPAPSAPAPVPLPGEEFEQREAPAPVEEEPAPAPEPSEPPAQAGEAPAEPTGM